MTQINAFVQAAKKAFMQLPLTDVAIDPALRSIQAAGGSIALEVFRAEKFKKIVFCTIIIDETGVQESTAMAWPDDEHNFPILWCNLYDRAGGDECAGIRFHTAYGHYRLAGVCRAVCRGHG